MYPKQHYAPYSSMPIPVPLICNTPTINPLNQINDHRMMQINPIQTNPLQHVSPYQRPNIYNVYQQQQPPNYQHVVPQKSSFHSNYLLATNSTNRQNPNHPTNSGINPTYKHIKTQLLIYLSYVFPFYYKHSKV